MSFVGGDKATGSSVSYYGMNFLRLKPLFLSIVVLVDPIVVVILAFVVESLLI